MKVSPLAQGGAPGTAIGAADVGRTADPVKIARARAIARGEKVPEEETGDPQADRVRPNVRSIKMNTQRSTNREEPILEAPPESVPAVDPPAQTLSSTPDAIEPGAVEDTQPLSPQLAALAKQKRALQVKERELLEREKALGAQPTEDGAKALIDRIKSQPLSVLQEHGVTYEQLTDAILNGNDALNPEIQTLKAELKALKEGVDKNFTERDSQQEKAALAEMRREADRLAAEGETFELVRATGSVPKAIDLIHRIYKESGEILDVSEALGLIEGELEKDALKLAALKKVQGKLAPQIPPQLQPQQRQMRTLTARDTAAPISDRRARAIAAFQGNKR